MDLQELRNEINDIDSQLQELFNKRMQISFKVAEYKIANNMPVFQSKRENEKLVVDVENYSKRIRYAVGPHAIYTVSGELLQWIHGFAAEHSVPIHLHLAETEGEVRNSIKQFGFTPVRYLYKLGILSPRLIIAHGIYVDDDEVRMLADHGVKVVHPI